MTGVSLIVLYPHPLDVSQFELDYQQHLVLLHEKTQIPPDTKPYTLTKFLPTPLGPAPFYQMFTLPFPSMDALQQTLASPAMQIVAADAVRISSGGAPQVLVGTAN